MTQPADPPATVGPFALDAVTTGDCAELLPLLPDESVSVLVTSPPYWGQRLSNGIGVEEDPREYVRTLVETFALFLPKLAPDGIMWINIGDAYNTPVNWRLDDRVYSTLGANGDGLAEDNSAYVKPRAKRKAFLSKEVPWLQYGNLLGLTYRLVLGLQDCGFLYRGEVVWQKRNPMPEGRCRRPHRGHEPIYLFARSERHSFQVSPPVKSVWDFANEKVQGPAHYSRFPEELPLRCIRAYGKVGKDVIVLDPFAGSGTTGIAASRLGCSFIGFEIDDAQAAAANHRIAAIDSARPLF